MYETKANASTYPNPHAYGMHRGSDESEHSWQGVPQQTPTYVHSALNTPTTEPLPWYLQQWAQKNQARVLPDSQNGSADFLPIQHPTEPDDKMEEDDGEKLVALGLYDTPDPCSSWGGFTEATGKGLKLEETWQPPEIDEDDEDEDEDVDDASSEASVEEPSPPLPQQAPQLQMPVQVKAQTPGNMEGQSFFFDEEETASKEWWYHELKQASVPVRDTGLGYGLVMNRVGLLDMFFFIREVISHIIFSDSIIFCIARRFDGSHWDWSIDTADTPASEGSRAHLANTKVRCIQYVLVSALTKLCGREPQDQTQNCMLEA